MDKKIRIILLVLLISGIGLCSWSIYNSISLSTKNNNDTTIKNNIASENQNTGEPIIIDSQTTDNNEKSTINSTVIDSKDEKSANGDNTNVSTSNSDLSPDEANSSNSVTSSTSSDTTTYVTYTVEENDTLASISKKYSENCPAKILSKAILSFNNLQSSKDIKKGMTIKIPEKYTKDGMKYTVEYGDSLYFIAEKYLSDLDIGDGIKQLLTDNYLTNENIQIGDQLYIHNGKAGDEDVAVSENNDDTAATNAVISQTDSDDSDTAASSSVNRLDGYTSYSIQKGDSLKTLGEKYSKTCPLKAAENIILKVNELTQNSDIEEGMKLMLPDKYLSSGSIYTVQFGDTLYDIALENMENIDVYEAINIISEDNSLKDQNIYAGQTLFIPAIEN